MKWWGCGRKALQSWWFVERIRGGTGIISALDGFDRRGDAPVGRQGKGGEEEGAEGGGCQEIAAMM